jgi:hypothetical protein
MSKYVLILGCGPAGLMAAHAATLAGFGVHIFSKKRKSEMFGAQYLHAPIPEASPNLSFPVHYQLQGDVEGYKEKVYGRGFRGTVSPEDLMGDHTGWDIRSTYDILWRRYSPYIIDRSFPTPQELHQFLHDMNMGHVVSTIPAPLLCVNPGHLFPSQEVWSVGDAPERGVFCPISVEEDTVVCNGERDVSWYRAANILGYKTAEWSMKNPPPFEGISKVTKPIGTSCNCLPGVHRAGRYGRWMKGVLSHTAFYETYAGLTGSEWR